MDERRKSQAMHVEESCFAERLVPHAKECCDSNPHIEEAGGVRGALFKWWAEEYSECSLRGDIISSQLEVQRALSPTN